MSSPKIRLCCESDLDTAFSLLNDCANWLASKGMDHWKGTIDKNKLASKISEKELYLLSLDSCIIGTIIISKSAPAYCDSVSSFWKNPSASFYYISKLAIHPDFHKNGYASLLLEFVNSLAIKNKIEFLRLDCVSNYSSLNDFYKKRGYVFVGSRNLYPPGPHCNFYEKKVN